jgi:hypothetical protein
MDDFDDISIPDILDRVVGALSATSTAPEVEAAVVAALSAVGVRGPVRVAAVRTPAIPTAWIVTLGTSRGSIPDSIAGFP